MEQKIILIPLAVFSMVILGFQSLYIIPNAWASASSNNITLPSGSTGIDSEMYLGGSASNRAFFTATNGGIIHLYTKANNILTISQDSSLLGSGGQMAYDTTRDYLWIFTTSGVYRFFGQSSTLVDFTSTATYDAGLVDAVYDSTRDRMYALDNTGGTGTIYDISPTNPTSFTAWTNTNMAGSNLLTSTTTTKLAVDSSDGYLFFNVAASSAANTVVRITSLTGTWNQDSSLAGLGSGNTPYSIGTDEDFNFLFVSMSDNSRVNKYDYTFNNLAIITVGTIPRHLTVESNTHRVYVAHSSANTTDIIDGSGNTLIQTLTVYSCQTPQLHLSVKYTGTTNGNYAVGGCLSNNHAFAIVDDANAGGNIVNGVDCDDPLKAQTLLCKLQTTNGVSLPAQFFNESASTLFCQTGLIACVENGNGGFTPIDPNNETNGVGYIIAIIALGIMVMIFYVASGGKIQEIPTFVWFIATLAVIGLLTGFNYLDPTFFVITIIVILALAAMKVKGVLGGESLFSSGGV